MAENNFTFLDDSLAAASVARGVTSAPVKPSGGGTFVLGFNTLAVVNGAVGLHANQTNFGPLKNDLGNPTGGSIRAAIKRAVSVGPTNFAPMLFINLQPVGGPTGSVADTAYLLGLSDSDPHQIILRKGAPSGGLLTTASGVLRKSTATYLNDTWLHIRLDSIRNPNGDVVLKCFANDLSVNPVTAPVWAAIAGMDDYIDDALSVNSGSAPITGGFVGVAFQATDIGRRAYVDHVQVLRQK